MHLSNEVVLRPRFKKRLEMDNETVLSAFEKAKNTQSNFIITRVDDHVFIKIPKDKQHYWSPQLHLEIINRGSAQSDLHGLFGPNPTVWTLFMFFHFAAATLFMVLGVWAYSNSSLDTPFMMQIVLMGLLVLVWFGL